MDVLSKVPAALAKTTFFSGDKINPLPLDVYGTTGNAIYNKISDLAEMLGLDPKGLARGSAFLKQHLPQIKALYKAGKDLANAGSLSTRIGAASTLFKAASPLIAGALPDGLAKTVTDAFNNNASTIVKLGDVAKQVQGVNLNDAYQVGDILGKLTGASGPFEITDKQSAVGVLAGVAINGCKNGIPNAISTALNSTVARDVMQETMRKIVPEVVKLGNVDYLKEVADKALSAGISLAGSSGYDKFIEKFQKGTVQDKADGMYAKYLDAAQSLDPGHGLMELNGQPVVNTPAPTDMSKDAYQCLKTDVIKGNVDTKLVATVANKVEPYVKSGSFLGTVTRVAAKQVFTSLTNNGEVGQKKVSR